MTLIIFLIYILIELTNLFSMSLKENRCIKEVEEDVYSVSQTHDNNCSYCNLRFTFKPEVEFSYLDKHKIDIDTNRFFTSEFIKINCTKSNHRNTSMKGSYPILCTIKSKDKDIYKFRIINCPSIRLCQTSWSCTAGFFPCDNKGDSIVYCTPQEKKLAKSSVTLSLYEKNVLNNNYEKKSSLIDRRKIWLLRRIVIGG